MGVCVGMGRSGDEGNGVIVGIGRSGDGGGVNVGMGGWCSVVVDDL